MSAAPVTRPEWCHAHAYVGLAYMSLILAQFVTTSILPVIRAVLSFHSGVLLATYLLRAGGKPERNRLVAFSHTQFFALVGCL